MSARAIVLAGLLVAAFGAGPAFADEVKTSIKAVNEVAPSQASLLLSITQPRELSGRALDRAILDPPPPSAASESKNSLTITFRNPCPPGEIHYEPRPLPGRRRF